MAYTNAALTPTVLRAQTGLRSTEGSSLKWFEEFLPQLLEYYACSEPVTF